MRLHYVCLSRCKCCCGPSDEYRETADVFASSDFKDGIRTCCKPCISTSLEDVGSPSAWPSSIKETTRSDAEKPGASPSEEHWLQRRLLHESCSLVYTTLNILLAGTLDVSNKM